MYHDAFARPIPLRRFPEPSAKVNLLKSVIVFAASLILVSLVAVYPGSIGRAEDYVLSADSMPREGVPKGQVLERRFTDSKVFPGTERKYWIYIPAQYDADKPACVMVFQDGNGYVNLKGHSRVPTVFDNLIHDGSMPVTIGILIDPGIIPPTKKKAQPRKNRSFEYDSLSDRYARFLYGRDPADRRRRLQLTDNAPERAIAGISSGGICASPLPGSDPMRFKR